LVSNFYVNSFSFCFTAHQQYGEGTINMIRQAVQLSGKSNVQLVTSSLLISDFLWQRNQLIIEVLGSVQHRDHSKVVISSRRWSGSNIHIIGVLGSGFIAVSDYEGSVADVIFVDAETGDMELIEH